MMVHTCIPSAWEVEKGGSDVQNVIGYRMIWRSALDTLGPILKERVGGDREAEERRTPSE